MIDDFERLQELIPAYLDGDISPEDREAFEAGLARSAELRDELASIKQIYIGLTIHDLAAGDHPESRLMALYASSPEMVDEEDRQDIEHHLETCGYCQEELVICREQPFPVPPRRSMWDSLIGAIKWFFSPGLILRPAYVAAALLLLVLPIGYMSVQDFTPSSGLQEFDIVPVGTRGELHSSNELEVIATDGVIRLQFTLPARRDRSYDCELRTAQEETLLIWNDYRPQGSSFSIDVPTAYLGAGEYTLRVIEEAGDLQEPETFDFRLHVQFTND